MLVWPVRGLKRMIRPLSSPTGMSEKYMDPSGAHVGPSVRPLLIFAVRVNSFSSFAPAGTTALALGAGTSSAGSASGHTSKLMRLTTIFMVASRGVGRAGHLTRRRRGVHSGESVPPPRRASIGRPIFSKSGDAVRFHHLLLAACLLVASVAQAEEPRTVQASLEQPIIGPGTTLTELQEYVDNLVPRMPQVESAEQWRGIDRDLRQRVLNGGIFRGE